MWQLIVTSRSWVEMTPATAPFGATLSLWPPPRHDHSLILPPLPPSTEGGGEPLVLLFGGIGFRSSVGSATGSPPDLDGYLWAFSLARRHWMRVYVPPGSPKPEPRMSYASIADASGAWIYGGLPGVSAGVWASAERELRTPWRYVTNVTGAARLCDASCGPHGECDLRWQQCVCEGSWEGDTCDEQRGGGATSWPRRCLRAGLLLAASLVAGVVCGTCQRQQQAARRLRTRSQLSSHTSQLLRPGGAGGARVSS